jgi:Protein of unknown function (DUF3455)
MSTKPRFHSRRAGFMALACLVGTVLAGCTQSTAARPSASPSTPPSPTPPAVPDNLRAPQGEQVMLAATGTGVQVYSCTPTAADPTRFEWTLKAPEADLMSQKGNKIGRHYAGPTWEANDGSKVVGAVKERANSPDPAAIQWLLLNAKSHDGNGTFSNVTSIQRLNTVGGKAPALGCDQSHAGAETRVDYTATYYFYTPRA